MQTCKGILCVSTQSPYNMASQPSLLTSGIGWLDDCFLVDVVVLCFVIFSSSGGWVKIKLKLLHFHVSDTCRVSD